MCNLFGRFIFKCFDQMSCNDLVMCIVGELIRHPSAGDKPRGTT